MHSRLKYIAAIAILIFTLSSTQLLAVGNPTVTGSISRGGTSGSFKLTVVITGITKTTVFAEEKSLLQRMRVWLTDLSASTDGYVKVAGDTTASPDVNFTISEISEPVSSAGSVADTTTFTYTLTISESAKGSLKNLLTVHGAGSSLKVQVSYLENNVTISTSVITTIANDTSVVQESPNILAVVPTHRALNVTWKIPETVTWSDSAVRAVTEITGLAIASDSEVLNLPSFIYDKTATSDAAGAEDACQYIPDFVDGGSCISCPNTQAYLDAEGLNKLNSAGKFVTTGTVKDGKLAISGLENDKDYGIVLFYQPGGLLRSTCLHGTPAKNLTWSELNDEKEAALKDPKCFIATAAYGSPLHKNLRPLRWFRDHVLLQTNFGSRFVEWYYENGPRGARVVAGSPTLQMTVQMLLWLPVIGISAWMALLNADPVFLKLALTAVFASLIVAAYVKRKTRETI